MACSTIYWGSPVRFLEYLLVPIYHIYNIFTVWLKFYITCCWMSDILLFSCSCSVFTLSNCTKPLRFVNLGLIVNPHDSLPLSDGCEMFSTILSHVVCILRNNLSMHYSLEFVIRSEALTVILQWTTHTQLPEKRTCDVVSTMEATYWIPPIPW